MIKSPTGLQQYLFIIPALRGVFKKMNRAKTVKSLHDKKPNGLTAITLGNALRFGATPPKKTPQRGKSKQLKQIKYIICHNHYR